MPQSGRLGAEVGAEVGAEAGADGGADGGADVGAGVSAAYGVGARVKQELRGSEIQSPPLEVTEGLTGGDHGEHSVMYLSHRLSKTRPFKTVA